MELGPRDHLKDITKESVIKLMSYSMFGIKFEIEKTFLVQE